MAQDNNSNVELNAKRERFKRIAEQRTNKILKMVRLLGNCANKSNYEYTDEEVKKIFTAIEKEVRLAKNKFEEAQNEENEFTL